MSEYRETWDLDALFEGGSSSEALQQSIEKIEKSISALEGKIGSLGKSPDDGWESVIVALQETTAALSEAANYVECLEAQDTSDANAGRLTGLLDALKAKQKSLEVQLEALFLSADDQAWDAFLARETISPISFTLRTQRELATKKMKPEEEILTSDLAIDGYHAWGRFYDKLAGWLRVDFKEEGSTRQLSMGQLHNKMESPDGAVRQHAFEKLEEAWGSVAEQSAMALNSQAGFRLTTYGRRRWDSVLFEPLHLNRMKRETLEAMWDVVASRSERLVPYYNEKARLLGKEKITWYDKSAPIATREKSFTYNEATVYILEQFERFNVDLADFARMAFEKRWIEAEDRPGKAAGGFCTDFPVSEATRIFMTFGGSFGSVSTLAHELGHAHHTWVLRKKPYWATEYPMTLAESASTFCETLILDAALANANSDEERLTLLDKKLDEAATMMMNLRSRFLFETSFFEERTRGPLTVSALNELMVNAQRTAYCGTLAEDAYHPLFWASKLHFYITQYPFYNFPYVFGFLFSNGLYDRALKEGPAFAKDYEALLGDTGIMTCEDLAKKHLGVDLTRPEFWEASVDRAISYVDDFVQLARKRG